MSHYPNVFTRLAVVLVCLCLTMIGRNGFALGPERAILTLPQRGAPSAGFVVTVSCDDLRLFGDVPVTISLSSSAGPFTNDRSLIAQITPVFRSTQPPGRDCVYELPIKLMQDSSSFEKTFYLPKWSVGGEWEVAIIEDRSPIKGYEGRVAGTSASFGQADMLWLESAESRFAWITRDANDAPDARVLLTILAPELLNINSIETSDSATYGQPFRQFRFTPTNELPIDWRGFDVADVWLIEPQTLVELFEVNPERGKALRAYLICGGTLWVIGNVDEPKLEQLFALPATDEEEHEKSIQSSIDMVSRDFSIDTFDNFRAVNSASYGASRAYLREAALLKHGSWQNPSGALNTTVELMFSNNRAWMDSLQQASKQPLSKDDYLYRPLGLGAIVVCRRDDPLPGVPTQWLAMSAITGTGLSETSSRGVDPCFGDRRYWDWIIPDVAQPPVYTFIGLLVLFTIIVGPVSYRKFTRLGRGYLMMFVAPMLALVTTLLMFVYGLVADGLSTRGRIREVTWIADKDQNAVRYSRATYFAGVSPNEGLTFPARSIVLPYQLPIVESWYDAAAMEHSTIGTIRFDDDKIRMDRGFLPSRQQKQFVTYHPLEKTGSVAFVDDTKLQIANTTKMSLRSGVIRDLDGNYHLFEQIEPSGKAMVKPIPRNEASELLSRMYTIQRPIAPAGVSTSRRQGEYTIDLLTQMQTRDARRPTGPFSGTNGESRIEAWLRSSLQIQSTIPPGWFVAFADVSDDSIVAPVSQLVESVHYVIGMLQ